MDMKRTVMLGTLTILFLSVVLASLVYAVPPRASDVEITPKITVKGPVAMGKAAKPPKQAATGILGDLVTGEKYAIVIGISDYYGEANDLEYADDDAMDFYNTLIAAYGFSDENIVLLIDGYATRLNILTAVNNLKETITAYDEVVFFYSGHGARGKANDGDREATDEAMVPYECTAESLIWDGQLAALFSGFATSRIIFIFDSCYSGGMTDLKAGGRIVVMACSENGLSYEFESFQNGQFTYYFVEEGIVAGKADIWDHDADGSFGEASDVVVEEAFDYAKANCKYQTPTISDTFTKDLLP
ncbi:caspase family protein [Candidatus Bathyarchaeota archaeon]|nr:caspase family protein [Candidatus Bathyarchaeota archaeon]